MRKNLLMEFRPIINSKKIFLAFILIFLLSPSLQAQNFWQFQWKLSKSSKVYLVEGLLVQMEDNSGFIRLAFQDDLKNQQIAEINLHLEYLKNTSGNIDSGYLVQVLGTPKLVSGTGLSILDNQCLLFKKLDPLEAVMPSQSGVLDAAGRLVTTLPLFSKKNLTEMMLVEPLLAKYFLKEEPLYKNYTAPKSRGGGFFVGKPIPTMHVIIVADLKDPSIGKGCKVDQTKLSQVYITIAQKLKVRLDTIFLVNDTYGKVAIQKALDNLKPGKDDMVLFHYTGHGFNREDSLDPYPNMFLVPYEQRTSWEKAKADEQELGLRTNTLGIQEIYQSIVAKGARLNIVFSDCCNTNYKLKNIPVNDLSGTSRGFTNLYPDYCKKLFLDEKVNILATAVIKGEQAASHPTKGSLYTNYYLQIINSFLSPAYNGSIEEVNWKSVIQGTEKKTKETAPSIYNTTTKSPFKMTPFSKIQLKKD
jgi:hypothetical protein